jgi:hypothetical protein
VALSVGQQPVAPVERRPERLLARRGGAAAGREHAEAVLEPRRKVLYRQDAHAGGGQLEGQGDAVQPPAHLGHRRGVVERQGELRQRRRRPVDEEPHRLGPGDVLDGGRPPGVGGVGHGEGRDPPHRLPRHP